MDSNQTPPLFPEPLPEEPSPEVTFWTPMRVLSSIVIFSVCALVGYSLFVAKEPTAPMKNAVNTRAGSAENSKVKGKMDLQPVANTEKLPKMSELVMGTSIKSIQGKTFKLSDYKGKVVLLNLWASWCGPCRMEIPELVKIREEFEGQDVEIVGLNVSPDSDDEKVIRDFIREFKISYPVGQADDELGEVLMSESNSIPQSFLITRDGKVYRHYEGYSKNLPQELRKSIQEALSIKS